MVSNNDVDQPLTVVKGRYLVAARQEGKSEATLRQYGWHLEKMVAWLSERGIEQTGEVSRDLLREWGAGLRDLWAPATIKQAVSAARAFFAWCLEEEIAETDPGRALKVPKVPKQVQRTMTLTEVRKLLAACDPKAVKGLRDLALINLLVDTGLRAGEICCARQDDVCLEARFLVVKIKGGDEDVAYFGETTTGQLRAWLEARPAADGVETVFVSVGGITPGQPLTPRGLRMILRRLGEKVGIEGVTTHAFRRGFACIATEAGAPSRMVQLAGRWSDIRMVEWYTQAMKRGELYGRWSPADHVGDKRKER